ncbi:MAG: hypothetical protein IJA89_08480 [Clostridia bacterium]|nr:hypothetical protein [Clostridia bacterium]
MKGIKKAIIGTMLSAFTLLSSGCSYISDLTDKIDELFCAHENVEIIKGVLPMCVDVGYTDGKRCVDCGKVLEERNKIPALGHDYQTLPAVEPTCNESGLTQGEQCVRCYDISIPQKIISATGHTWSESYGYCNVCGLNYDYKDILDGEYTLRPMQVGDTFANKWIRISIEDVPDSGFLFVGRSADDHFITDILYGFGNLADGGFCAVDENGDEVQLEKSPFYNEVEYAYGFYCVDIYIPVGAYRFTDLNLTVEITEDTPICSFFNTYNENNIGVYEIVTNEGGE